MNLDFSTVHEGKFEKHFGADMDDVSLVLKSHLFLEEMLRSFCFEMVPQPRYLAESRLTFAQVVDLSRALYPVELKLGWLSELWPLADRINRIRNLMAHALDPDPVKLANHREVFITTVKSRFSGSEAYEFRSCLEAVLGGMNFVLQAGVTHKNGEDPLKILRKTLE
ncbi:MULTISPECIES: hypothetical protein [Pseudomonas]|uniref:hypothetical protein n=1 Tax=Pseudomonas TaxID=286 RepID=UPI001AE75AEF|nr:MULTISPECIES: hypothetical protein [unclassified Pseudomonas]MBP1086068.1 hypothetical protein [Pseudomonas sp. PvP007]MBP1192897.1 hypothetical protein [Pseudomonas sp. PvP100]